MAREKAQYKGQVLLETTPSEIPEVLRKKLRGFCPVQQESEGPWDSPADEFANEIIAEASWAISQLFYSQEDITKGEVRAERDDLLRILSAANAKLLEAENKFRRISPALDRLLAIDPHPLDSADRLRICSGFISTLTDQLESITQKIENLPKSGPPAQKDHWIAVEMTINVLRVLKKYGIPSSVYASAEHEGCQSKAVTILCTIGKHIGLAMKSTTWRDIISEAKEQAPDLN